MSKNNLLIIGAIVLIILSLVGFGVFRKSGVTQSPAVSSPIPQTPTRKSVSYNCEQGKTAFELLESSYQTDTKDTSFGKMVMGIDNVKSEENKDFWAFYVDNKQATVGAQLYNCMDQEKIEWKLEKIL
jgi:hypothetical protein